MENLHMFFISDIAVFVLKKDVKLQLYVAYVLRMVIPPILVNVWYINPSVSTYYNFNSHFPAEFR